MRMTSNRVSWCLAGICLGLPVASAQFGGGLAGSALDQAGMSGTVLVTQPGSEPQATAGIRTGFFFVDHPPAVAGAAGHLLTANLADEYRVVRLWPQSEAFDTIHEALENRAERLSFSETPLRDVVAELSDHAGVRIVIDQKALEEAGVDGNTPITAELSGLTFKAALRTILDRVDLGGCFKDEQYLITTQEKAIQNPVKVLYPTVGGISAGALESLLVQATATGTWDQDGGPGRVIPVPDGSGAGVIVSHSAEAHEEIEAFLRSLDGAYWTPSESPRDDFGFVRVYDLDEGSVAVLTTERDGGFLEEFVRICNDALPRQADVDPEAKVLSVGRTILVRSKSRAFHGIAAQLLSSLCRPAPVIEAGTLPAGAGGGIGGGMGGGMGGMF